MCIRDSARRPRSTTALAMTLHVPEGWAAAALVRYWPCSPCPARGAWQRVSATSRPTGPCK
eukprot:13047242-Alexandrium_andersonii.AAC.1